jgi:hypothetical protein
MIRDMQQSHSIPVSNSLSVEDNQELINIFSYIDFSIDKFYDFYITYGDSEKENRVTDLLVACFEEHLSSFNGGYFSIRFSKNSTEKKSNREPDIGVFLRKTIKPFKPIIVFEAKRLYDSSHSCEYVYGDTGGIERFKRCNHASDDDICGMIGYIQNKDPNYWFIKINNWISKLANENTDKTIDWTRESEKLKLENSFVRVQKYSSLNYRKAKNDSIRILHYFIELI